MKTIVLYYSRSQKTKTVAKTLASELNIDIVEIKDYKSRKGVLNYVKASVDALRENKTDIYFENNKNLNLSEYDLIYLGSPTWAGNPVPAIITFIDQMDLQDKDVIPFITMTSYSTSALKRMEEKLLARGARPIFFFGIQTGGKKLVEIQEKTRDLIKESDLYIYNNK